MVAHGGFVPAALADAKFLKMLPSTMPKLAPRTTSEEYFIWKEAMEQFFKHHNFSSIKKMRIAKRTFADEVRRWWHYYTKRHHRRFSEPSVKLVCDDFVITDGLKPSVKKISQTVRK